MGWSHVLRCNHKMQIAISFTILGMSLRYELWKTSVESKNSASRMSLGKIGICRWGRNRPHLMSCDMFIRQLSSHVSLLYPRYDPLTHISVDDVVYIGTSTAKTVVLDVTFFGVHTVKDDQFLEARSISEFVMATSPRTLVQVAVSPLIDYVWNAS